MATITLTPPCNANLLAYENNNTHVREASFSSYLSSNEENFALKLAETTRTPQEHPYQISLGRKKTEDGEICVFGAEKYFNSGIDDKTRIAENGRKHQPKKDPRIELHQIKPTIKFETPSTCSEVSWNSQTALLPSLLRDPSAGRRIRANGRGFFATFGCKGYCSDKKSVGIDENVGENKIVRNYKTNFDLGEVHGGRAITKVPIEMHQDPVSLVQIKQTRPQSMLKEEIPCQNFGKAGLGLQRKDCFAFPISNSEVGNLTVRFEKVKEGEDKERKSLEVFGSPVLAKEDIAISLERRLTMLTWDSNPRSKDITATPYSSGMNEDIESDSSSDLFEIKSLSSNAHTSFSRQVSGGFSNCMSPNACYEPSEASIEWSVVTASAANFSVASDFDEQKPITIGTNHNAPLTPQKIMTTKAKSAMGREVPKRRPSMLSGCRSHKAVKVVGEAYMMSGKANSDPQRGHRPGSLPPVARFKAETKVIDFESAHVQGPAFATHSVYMN